MREFLRHALRLTVVMALVSVTYLMANAGDSPTNSLPQIQQIDCLVKPRTLAELEALVAQATPPPGNDIPFFIIDALLEGHAPDRAVSKGVISAVLVLNAGASTGSPLQYYALMTDDYVSRTAAGANSTAVLEEIRSTPASVNVNNIHHYIAAIGHIRELSDHRASAIVTLGGIEDSHPAPGRTFLMIFANVEGRWLLDGRYDQVWSDETPDTPVWIADLFPPTLELPTHVIQSAAREPHQRHR